MHEPPPGRAALRQEQRVLRPGGRVVHVFGRRDDVVIAHHHQPLLPFEKLPHARLQRLHPGELVIVLVARRGIAVRQVETDDAHRRLALGRDQRLDIARLLVGEAGQAARHVLDRMLGEQRDAVIGLLPVRLGLVAHRLELEAREGVVDALDLLEPGDVRLGLLHPGQHGVEPRLDRIDVPGGDLHCASSGRPCPLRMSEASTLSLLSPHLAVTSSDLERSASSRALPSSSTSVATSVLLASL